MIKKNAYTAPIEGYASIFNAPDQNGDIIAPGAFAASLQQASPVRMLYQHAVEAPIGRWLTLREDARGLFVKGEIILSSDKAREVYALLEGGAIDGLSIGFQTVKAKKTNGGRLITKAALWEVSIVTFPMAPAARVTRLGSPRGLAAPAGEPHPSALFADAVRGAGRILADRTS
ncbi:MAG: HK97 family phage prohead protease [Pseudomonadota bacterium]